MKKDLFFFLTEPRDGLRTFLTGTKRTGKLLEGTVSQEFSTGQKK
jgi:hypothetical protein